MYSEPEIPEMPDSRIQMSERSPLALAFVGDGVLELMVRGQLVSSSRAAPGKLHHEAVKMVSAAAQAKGLQALRPMLTPEELDMVRRGRNASKASVPKNATVEDYRASTGLETLLGWLYLQNQTGRLRQLFDCLWNLYLESHLK